MVRGGGARVDRTLKQGEGPSHVQFGYLQRRKILEEWIEGLASPGRLILRAEYNVPIPSSPVKRIRGQVRAVRPYNGAALIIDRHTLEELGTTPIGEDALSHQV